MGQDWTVVSGAEDGLTQIGQKGGSKHCVVWNFPIDLTFRSSNIFGWPQIVLAVYGLDGLGRDVIRGYGAIHFPTTVGRHVLKVNLFAPQAASPLQRLTAWVNAAQAEFVDPKFAAKAVGRDGMCENISCICCFVDVMIVVRVSSNGIATVVINIATKDLTAAGYSIGTSSQPI